jgi:hypothetical protein
LLGEPDGFRLRQFPSFSSSRSGHATRRDASLIAMRRPLQKLYLLFFPVNPTANGREQGVLGARRHPVWMRESPIEHRLFSTDSACASSG